MRYSCFGKETDNIFYHSAFGKNTPTSKRKRNKITFAEKLYEWEKTAKMEQFRNAVVR